MARFSSAPPLSSEHSLLFHLHPPFADGYNSQTSSDPELSNWLAEARRSQQVRQQQYNDADGATLARIRKRRADNPPEKCHIL
jgi:hypothetical protein